MQLPDDTYKQLLRFRTRLRQFQHWSADQARSVGLTPTQHQLLLAIRGHGNSPAPTVGDIAQYLLLRHHSAAELTQRAEQAGLITRIRDQGDHRIIRLGLTANASERLEKLSELHVRELSQFKADALLDFLSSPSMSSWTSGSTVFESSS